jgi:hypothetical protein
MSSAAGSRSAEGLIRTSLVYVRVPSEAGPFLVPFGAYDDWSLRDRYNEAIRIMNTLGASRSSRREPPIGSQAGNGYWNGANAQGFEAAFSRRCSPT